MRRGPVMTEIADDAVPGPMFELVVEFPRPYDLHNGGSVVSLSDCEVRIPFLFREDADEARRLTGIYVRECEARTGERR
jgi:hypothetical protein